MDHTTSGPSPRFGSPDQLPAGEVCSGALSECAETPGAASGASVLSAATSAIRRISSAKARNGADVRRTENLGGTVMWGYCTPVVKCEPRSECASEFCAVWGRRLKSRLSSLRLTVRLRGRRCVHAEPVL